MDRHELYRSLAAAGLGPDDMVYVERRGTAYSWQPVTLGAELPPADTGADVWMYFSGQWPCGDPIRFEAFCEDMLAELETMAGGFGDRCRWPLSEPYPLTH